MSKTKYSEEQKQQVHTLYQQSFKKSQISKQTGIPLSTVNDWLGKKTVGKVNTLDYNLIVKAENLYLKGYSLLEISHKLNVNRRTLSLKLKDRGHTINKYGAQIKAVKHNPFTNLKCANTLYWLGVLAGDGCISKGHVMLSLNDTGLLEQYLEFINSPCLKITNCNSKLKTVQFMSHEVANYLNSLGLVQNKTFNLKLNFKMNSSFVRGIFDADGSVWIRNQKTQSLAVEISEASKVFMQQLSKFLNENYITNTLKTRTVSYKNRDSITYRISLSDQKVISKFRDFIYLEGKYCLKRKRDIFYLGKEIV